MNNETFLEVKIAIIGGGAAGIHAASCFNYFKYSNCIIEENEFLGGQPVQLYSNKEVNDWPGYESIVSNDIISNLINQMESYDKTKVFLSTEISDILEEENDKYKIITNKGIIVAENIVIATGIGAFLPNKLEINNEIIEKNNIHYTVDQNLEQYKNKRIIVMGGGDSAIDWANFFVEKNISKYVAIVHRRNEYRSNKKTVDDLAKNNIKEFLNYEVIEISDNILRIKHNDTNEIYKINYDFIIVQYGQKANLSNLDFFNKINKNEIKKILVDQNQKTNLKNVFAIGGCTYYNAKSNTILIACAEGMAVAWYLAKNKLPWFNN